ncbi:MAG: tetratricopeptide repeat protein [Planctomycetaceae bacterium]
MNRLNCALVVACTLSVISGCKSGPLARLSGSQDTSSLASTVPEAAENLDPRVARLEKRGRFDKPKIPQEYADMKAATDNPEKIMLSLASYFQEAADKQGNPALLEQARQKYTTLLTDNPNSLKAMIGLAQVDLKADRLGDAESMYKTVLAKFPNDPEAMSAVAGFFNATDRPGEVLKLLPKAIQANPEDRALRSQMGVALVKAGQSEAAVPHFTKIGGQASAYATIGQLLVDQDKTQEAEQYLRRAIERNPKLDGAKQVLAELGGNVGDIQQATNEQVSRRTNQLKNAVGTRLRR